MSESRRYINVDDLAPTVSIEQVLSYYGVNAELHRVGQHIRSACFLNCQKSDPTGKRALAIEAEGLHRFRCHQYGCGKAGNLVGLIDLVKPGAHQEGRPRGERFRAIAEDLLRMGQGELSATPAPAPAPPSTPTKKEPERDLPLAESPDERVRALVQLPEQFIHDVAAMPPHAASYLRRRPFLTDATMIERFQFGYLPASSKSMLRGRVVYAYHDEVGQLIGFFARDTQFEEKHAAWAASDRHEPEPVKVRFPTGFHRTQHVYARWQLRALDEAAIRSRPLVIVEGANDAIRLHAAGVAAVALCSNSIAHEQVAIVAGLAREHCNGTVTLLLDCDEEGERGAQDVLWQLAQAVPTRLGWTRNQEKRRWANRQPEQLADAELAALRGILD